jgi:hypothetical protein
MTANGTHERIQSKEIVRVFAISGIRLDGTGQVADVLWAEVDEKSNLDVGGPMRAAASEAITAIHAGHQVLAVFPKSGRTDYSLSANTRMDGRRSLWKALRPSVGKSET